MSLFAINSTQQYLDYTGQDTAVVNQVTQYFTVFKQSRSADAAVLAVTLGKLLPVLSARITRVSRALTSQGRILADTRIYGNQFAGSASVLSAPTVNNMQNLVSGDANGTTSPDSAVDAFNAAASSFKDESELLVSSSSYYSAYSGHLKDRNERLMVELQNLTNDYNFFTIVYSVLVS